MFFISYKVQEFDQALGVRRALEDAGMACWMAPDSIEPGSEYGEQITNAIRNCDALVLILSEIAQTSTPVLSEVDLARSFDKVVIPFHLDESELTDAFLFRLGIFQRIEAAHDLEGAYASLVEGAKGLLEGETVRADEPPDQSHRPSAHAETVTKPESKARAHGNEETDPRFLPVDPADRPRIATRVRLWFLGMLAFWALWLSMLKGSYDSWPVYAVVLMPLVLENNFTVSLYQLMTLWEQDATGWKKSLLQPRARALVLLVASDLE